MPNLHLPDQIPLLFQIHYVLSLHRPLRGPKMQTHLIIYPMHPCNFQHFGNYHQQFYPIFSIVYHLNVRILLLYQTAFAIFCTLLCSFYLPVLILTILHPNVWIHFFDHVLPLQVFCTHLFPDPVTFFASVIVSTNVPFLVIPFWMYGFYPVATVPIHVPPVSVPLRPVILLYQPALIVSLWHLPVQRPCSFY